MNQMKLKAKLVELKKTYEECAKALNISETSFSNKMNGKTAFKLNEIKILSNFLNLTREEIDVIFLN